MRLRLLIPVVTAITALSASAASAQPTSRACGFLTAAEVAKVLQRPALANIRPIGSVDPDVPGASECGYGADFHIYHQPSLPGSPPPSPAAFDNNAAARVKTGEYTPLSGVGDAAWFYRNKAAQEFGVLVRVGQQVMRMAVPMSFGSEAAARTALTSLAQTVTAKLR